MCICENNHCTCGGVILSKLNIFMMKYKGKGLIFLFDQYFLHSLCAYFIKYDGGGTECFQAKTLCTAGCVVIREQQIIKRYICTCLTIWQSVHYIIQGRKTLSYNSTFMVIVHKNMATATIKNMTTATIKICQRSSVSYLQRLSLKAPQHCLSLTHPVQPHLLEGPV